MTTEPAVVIEGRSQSEVARAYGRVLRGEADIADRFGSQCVVASVDAKRWSDGRDGWEIFTHGGRNPTGIDALDHAVYDAVASTPTPTLDVPARWLSKAANYSVLSILIAGVLGTVHDGAGRCRRAQLINRRRAR